MVPNIPTALTWLRIVLIPVFVGIYYVPQDWLTPVMANWIGMGVFALAAITDWLDGYLARRLGATSAFGAFLDPVADKLMVAAALILLVELGRAEAYLAIIIIGREIAISALRAHRRRRISGARSARHRRRTRAGRRRVGSAGRAGVASDGADRHREGTRAEAGPRGHRFPRP